MLRFTCWLLQQQATAEVRRLYCHDQWLARGTLPTTICLSNITSCRRADLIRNRVLLDAVGQGGTADRRRLPDAGSAAGAGG